MDKVVLFFIGWLSIISLVLYTKSKVDKSYYYYFLGTKILFGLFSAWLYNNYYQSGDVLNIQQDARLLVVITDKSYVDYLLFLLDKGQNYQSILHQIFYEGEPRTLFFVKIISLVNLFSLSNFWACSVFLSVLGFCATVYGIEIISKYYKIKIMSLKISFFLVPSIGVWTSGIMKEAVVIPALLLAIACILSKPNFLKYGLAIILVWVSFTLKYYFVVPLIVLVASSMVINKIGLNVWVIIGGIVVSLFMMLLHPNLNFDKFYAAVIASHNLTLASSYSTNSISFSSLASGWYWLILYLPKAWYYGLFSPLPWQAYSMMSYLQSVQSIGILTLVFWSVYSLITTKKEYTFQVFIFVFYILFMAGLLPLCSPNIGSLSRYSVIYLPVLITLCLQLYYEKQNNPYS